VFDFGSGDFEEDTFVKVLLEASPDAPPVLFPPIPLDFSTLFAAD
jgi:hypothetical protein